MRLSRKQLGTTLVFISAISVAAPSAAAVSTAYASPSSPQTVSGYGSWAKTYGNYTVTRLSATSARATLSSNYYKYYDSDNHTVYTYMGATGNGAWTTSGTGESSHDNTYSSSWTSFRTRPSKQVNATAGPLTTVNGTVITYLDVPWRSDPASSTKYLSFSRF